MTLKMDQSHWWWHNSISLSVSDL